jgi:ATP/ADP translocase
LFFGFRFVIQFVVVVVVAIAIAIAIAAKFYIQKVLLRCSIKLLFNEVKKIKKKTKAKEKKKMSSELKYFEIKPYTN